MTRRRAHTTERARTEVRVGQVSVSVTELKISSLVPGQFTASTLKSVTEGKYFYTETLFDLIFQNIFYDYEQIFIIIILKILRFPPSGGPLGLSKSYGLVASSPKSSTIISRDKLMAVSTELSTARLDKSLFFLPQDSKFSLPYVQTACGGDFRI